MSEDVDVTSPVTLRNGEEVSLERFRTILTGLATLHNDPKDFFNLVLYELRKKCEDPDHPIFGNYQQRLTEQGLLDETGQPPADVCSMVRNSLVETSEGFPTVTSPVEVYLTPDNRPRQEEV